MKDDYQSHCPGCGKDLNTERQTAWDMEGNEWCCDCYMEHQPDEKYLIDCFIDEEDQREEGE